MNRNMYTLTGNMLKLIFPNINVTYIGSMFKLITKLLKNNGTLFTVKYLKQVRLHVTRYLAGQPLLVNKSGVSLDSNGGPTAILFLKPLANGSLKDKKYLLTLLGLSRSLKAKRSENIPVDLSTITNPYKGTGYKIPNSFIKDYLTKHNMTRSLPEFSWKNIYFSMKSGPNGPATLTILKTILSLDGYMFTAIPRLIGQKGFDWVCRLYKFAGDHDLEKISTSSKKDSPRHTKALRRLSIVRDPECKMRIICILDYISQLALTPMHEILYGILKQIPQDRTFTQDPRSEGEDNEHSYGSIDLSAATDRFPREFQERVISYIFKDREIGRAGSNILVGPRIEDMDGNPISYSVGQPMGAKSSGAAFAISHHILVNYCASLVGITDFTQYILLGDDIVIKHDKVAQKYCEILSKIGVETSEAKTHVSKNTYEFAKRGFQDGKEITGLPMSGLIENSTNPFIVGYILFDYFIIKRNTYFSQLGLDRLVASFYSKSKLYRKIGKKTSVFHLSYKYSLDQISNFSFVLRQIFNLSTYDEQRKFFAINTRKVEDYALPTPKVILSEIDRVFGNAMNGMVLQSVKKIDVVFKDLDKISKFYNITRDSLPETPIVGALYNRVLDLKNLQNKILKGATLKDIVETLLLVDIDSVTQLDRKSYEIVVKTGQLTGYVRKHLSFDPEYTVPKARTLSVVKSTRDLEHNFKKMLTSRIEEMS